MNEFFAEALTLDIEESGEMDKRIHLYAKNLGRIAAKAKSARKVTSKLACQLEPLNLIRTRLIEKNGFQIVDAVVFKKFHKSFAAVRFARFLKEMTPEFQPDKKLWLAAKKSFEDLKTGGFSYVPVLEALGFAPAFAECAGCSSPVRASGETNYFFPKEQIFLCGRCGLKAPRDELILIR